MALLVVCGGPATGKTTVAERIASWLQSERKLDVEIVGDEVQTRFTDRDETYSDPTKEKAHLSGLRAELERRITANPERIFIFDSLNNIKGFRYEIFLVAKLAKVKYAVLYCSAVDRDVQHVLNSQRSPRYSDAVLDELQSRFEPPNERFRWERPLFTIRVGRDERTDESEMTMAGPRQASLPLDDIAQWLEHTSALRPNCSTMNEPVTAGNWLTTVEKVTTQVVREVLDKQAGVPIGQHIPVMPNTIAEKGQVVVRRIRGAGELERLRRQFVTYQKSHRVDGSDTIAALFVAYLNSN